MACIKKTRRDVYGKSNQAKWRHNILRLTIFTVFQHNTLSDSHDYTPAEIHAFHLVYSVLWALLSGAYILWNREAQRWGAVLLSLASRGELSKGSNMAKMDHYFNCISPGKLPQKIVILREKLALVSWVVRFIVGVLLSIHLLFVCVSWA